MVAGEYLETQKIIRIKLSTLNRLKKEFPSLKDESISEYFERLSKRTHFWNFTRTGENKIYSIELTEGRFNRLWESFQEWTGSQEDFYFKFVNPLRNLLGKEE
jgi:hypothetical protein